jgi:hypothetical protein
MGKHKFIIISLLSLLVSCSKNSGDTPAPFEADFTNTTLQVNGISNNTFIYNNISSTPVIKLSFTNAVKQSSASGSILFNESTGASVPFNIAYENRDSTIILRPVTALKGFTNYTVIISSTLQSVSNKNLKNSININVSSGIDSTDKFPLISDNALLDLVQQQTFKYFWEFGHPVSGLARERNTSGDIVTSGGSGFGIMAIVTAVNRGFITRPEGLARMQKMVAFLKNTAQSFTAHFLIGSMAAPA